MIDMYIYNIGNSLAFVSLKRRRDDSRALRVLTGSIEKAIKWEKMKEISALLFEVIGEKTVN